MHIWNRHAVFYIQKFEYLVAPTGIEPVTLGLWVLRSNQLSYGATYKKYSP